FLGLAPRSLHDVYSDIALLARVMGAEHQGAQVVVRMKKEIAAVRAKTSARRTRRPRVFCEEWGKPIIHSQRWVAELVEAAGGEFLGEPGKQTGAECVRRADPEVIIAAWCGAGDRVPLEKIIEQRGWQGVNAARAGRVYCIRDEYLNTPAPTLLLGLKALAAAIRPDLFPGARGLRRIASSSAGTRRRG
ncbi:MAG: ABC transporter substrate-binding protein, partial [Terriglobales bacterium]